MRDTPGYYYALAYSMASISLAAALGRPRSFWSAVLTDLGIAAVLLGFMHLTAGAQGALFIVSIAAIVGMIFLHLRLRCRFAPGRTLCMALRAFIVGESAASLSWLINYRMLRLERLPSVLSTLLLYLLLTVLLILSERGLLRGSGSLPVNGRVIAIQLITALLVFIISNMSYVSADSLFGTGVLTDIFIIRTLADICGVVLLYAYELQLRDAAAHFEVNTLREAMRMQYRSYQQSKESIDMVNRKYHDLKHQIAVLRTMAPEEKQVHLDALEQEIRAYEARQNTGHPVLDTVLTAKHDVCGQDGIELRVMADGARLAFMNEMDISILFGNLLDNAIECVQRIPERQERLIRIYVGSRHSFLLVRVGNRCPETLTFEDGLPRTTKRDENLHGYGMKSVRALAEKYGGSFTARLEDGWFEACALFPGRGSEETGGDDGK